jgi:phospholipid/cholesterol/gamma-HCH transport system ATP-binding protein
MTASESASILRFEKVTVIFDDGVKALDEISFNVREGQTRIILGAAGSGKTVLLKTAMGLNCATAGQVFLFDEEVTKKPEVQLFDVRSKIGMLFQESALFDSMTVAQNVAYPLLNQKAIQMPRERMEPAVRDSLRFVELEQTMDRYPSELSGGMRRRVAIARAVVSKPAVSIRWNNPGGPPGKRGQRRYSWFSRRGVWFLKGIRRIWNRAPILIYPSL